ncbi:MAG: DUF3084 domain-containing protein [Fretibacterium sp.]
MQTQVWSGTNWPLIVGLILGSAALAVLGDVLGFKYGKQRISVFGLRPKYTSRLITAVTGAIISIVILTVLSLFSQDVRTALFSMQYIQQQLMDLHVQLQSSQSNAAQAMEELSLARRSLADQQGLLQTTTLSLDLARFDLESLRNDKLVLENEKNELGAEVASMREESDELKRALSSMRSEAIAIHPHVLLAQQAVLPNSSAAQVSEDLQTLAKNARRSLLSGLSEKLSQGMRDLTIAFDPNEEAELIERLTNFPERSYVRALSAENVALGEPVRVRLEMGTSHRIYAVGEPVYRKLIHAQRPDFDAEEALHLFLRELKLKAIRDGVLPDPATNSVGTVEGVTFFDVVESLKDVHAPVIVSALASHDIYTEGPVDIEFVLEE